MQGASKPFFCEKIAAWRLTRKLKEDKALRFRAKSEDEIPVELQWYGAWSRKKRRKGLDGAVSVNNPGEGARNR